MGSPTFTYDFAASLRELLKTEAYGTYHVAGQGSECSRYDVACEMMKLLGLENKVTVTKVSSDFFAKEY